MPCSTPEELAKVKLWVELWRRGVHERREKSHLMHVEKGELGRVGGKRIDQRKSLAIGAAMYHLCSCGLSGCGSQY